MKYVLWIIQVLLAVAFIGAGIAKITTPYDTLIVSQGMQWAEMFPAPIILTIGVLEVLGGIGLILPALTRIMPILTPAAAIGLALTMVGAAITHGIRAEWGNIAPSAVLGGLALFIAYGRLSIMPIEPRTPKA
ncbi:MAG: DoxX family protein [Phototrophicaceae bacterium]